MSSSAKRQCDRALGDDAGPGGLVHAAFSGLRRTWQSLRLNVRFSSIALLLVHTANFLSVCDNSA